MLALVRKELRLHPRDGAGSVHDLVEAVVDDYLEARGVGLKLDRSPVENDIQDKAGENAIHRLMLENNTLCIRFVQCRCIVSYRMKL